VVRLAVLSGVLVSFLVAVPVRAEEQSVPLTFVKTVTFPDAGRIGVPLGPDGRGTLRLPTENGDVRVTLLDNRVVVDLDGDGTFSEAEKAASVGIQQSFSVPVRIGTRTVQYRLRVDWANESFVVLSGGGALACEIDLTPVRILDANLNGRFGEVNIDTVLVGTRDASTSSLPRFSRHIVVGEKIYAIEISDTAEALIVTPYEGPTATVSIECDETVTEARLMLSHESEGEFSCDLTKAKQHTLIPGKYQIASTTLTIAATEDTRSLWDRLLGSAERDDRLMLSGSYSPDAPPLDIPAGASTVRLGPPLTLAFTVTRAPGGPTDLLTIEDAYLTGASGERYRASMPGVASATLKWCIRSEAGEGNATTLEYG
jgi:hypothetical protein